MNIVVFQQKLSDPQSRPLENAFVCKQEWFLTCTSSFFVEKDFVNGWNLEWKGPRFCVLCFCDVTMASIVTPCIVSTIKRNPLHFTDLVCHPSVVSIIYLIFFLIFLFALAFTFHYFYSNNFFVLFFSFLRFFLVHTSNMDAVPIHFHHCASKCLINVVRFFCTYRTVNLTVL